MKLTKKLIEDRTERLIWDMDLLNRKYKEVEKEQNERMYKITELKNELIELQKEMDSLIDKGE